MQFSSMVNAENSISVVKDETLPISGHVLGMQPRRSRWQPLLLFFGFLAIYHINGKPQAEIDCVPAPYTAWALVQHGNLDLRHYAEIKPMIGSAVTELPDGTLLSRYPPGSAISAVPVVTPFALICEQPLRSTLMLHLGKLVGAIYAAGAVSVFFLLCQTLVPRAAWPATLLFGLGTGLWSVASQASWMHGPATFWLCLALYVLLRFEASVTWALIVSGVTLGMAVITRPTTALFLLPTMLVVFRFGGFRPLMILGLSAAVPIGLMLAFNYNYFANPFAGGYREEAKQWTTPLWLGMPGLLVAPSRGLLIYTPALLLLPLGVGALIRSQIIVSFRRFLVFGWLAAGFATIMVYARWHAWWGGWCFGPRFLCETMPILCLVFGLGYQGLQTVAQQRFALTLVGLSVLVQFVGVFGHQMKWNARHDIPDQGRSLFSIRDTQIQAHVLHLLRLDRGARTP